MDSGQMNVGAAATLVQSAQELVDQSGINQSSPSKAKIVNDDEGTKLDFAQFEEFDGIKCAKIVTQDVEPEIVYWQPSIVCCVVGANPPFKAMNGFFNRIWSAHNIHKVLALNDGLYFSNFTQQKRGMKF